MTARVQRVFQNTNRPRGQRLGYDHSRTGSNSRRYLVTSRQPVATANGISGEAIVNARSGKQTGLLLFLKTDPDTYFT